MKWNNRLTNYNFWISLVSAVLLILQAFDLQFDVAYANEIVTAVLGLLVVIGIINDPTKSSVKTEHKSENKTETPSETPALNVESIQQPIPEAVEGENLPLENDGENIQHEIATEANSTATVEEAVTEGLNNTPFVSAVENSDGINENDFKAIINKISADLNYCLNQLAINKTVEEESLTNGQLTEINKEILQTEEMPKPEDVLSENSSTQEEQSTCYSIVN